MCWVLIENKMAIFVLYAGALGTFTVDANTVLSKGLILRLHYDVG